MRLRSVAIGSAGVWLALALGAVAALTAFIAAAGPRILAAAQDQAVRQATAVLTQADRTVVVSGDWVAAPGVRGGLLSAPEQATFGLDIAARLGPPLPAMSVAAHRAYVSEVPFVLPAAAPSAMVGPDAPEFQISEDSDLGADATLVAGKLPSTATLGIPGRPAADREALTLQVAVSPAVASRFSLRVGSTLALGRIGGRPVRIAVTGIAAARPGSLLAESGQAQLVPYFNCNSSSSCGRQSTVQRWIGGAVVGPAELGALQQAMTGSVIHGAWYLPANLRHMTPANLGPAAAEVDSLESSPAVAAAALAIGFRGLGGATIGSQLPAELESIRAQLSTTGSIYDLVIGGTFAAELLLILLCAGLAADRYHPEFALIRARGGSVRQVTLLALSRSASATVPGVLVGLAVAIIAFPTSGVTTAAVILPVLTAVIAVIAAPVRCAWKLRTVTVHGARRADFASPRRSPRRVIAETTILVLTAGSLVALRVRGLGSGSDQLALVSPILVATTASIVIGRLYPIPIRALLPLTRMRRGAVGFLGLTKAGRSGLATLLPALALVLTLTLAAFGWMVSQSIATGQVSSSWNQTGADAVITATGDGAITTGQAEPIAAVPGIRHAALAYTALANGLFAASLTGRGSKTTSVGLAVVDPVQYAALARDTPWTGFPAGVLSRRRGPVPVLISAGAAAQPGVDAAVGSRQILDLDGINLPVFVAGTIGATATFPAGGTFVVMPQWAESQFPSIAGANTLLVTGPGAASARFAAVARRLLPGYPLALRARALRAARGSAAQEADRLLAFGTWTAAALSALALLFGLAATARPRRTTQARLAALGISARQAGALALLDPLSLLIVGIVGMAASGAALAALSSDVISIAPLTGPFANAPVSLDLPALAIPAAGAILLGLVITGAEHWLVGRADNASALRADEAV